MSWSIQALGTVFGVCQSPHYCPGQPGPLSLCQGSPGAGGAGLGFAGGRSHQEDVVARHALL